MDSQRRAFDNALRTLRVRLQLFTSLRLDALDALALKRELDSIGRTDH